MDQKKIDLLEEEVNNLKKENQRLQSLINAMWQGFLSFYRNF